MAKTFSYAGPPLITMDIPAIEVKLAEANLDNVHAAMIQRMVDWAVAAGTDVLKTALPRTPWDTGKLRKSGTVTIDIGGKRIDVASGRRSDNGMRILSGMNKLTPQLSRRIMKRVRTISAIVHFHRVADSAEGLRDVAIWTHEDLNPHGSGVSPQARKPGTGPKYLESAFREKGAKWAKMSPMIEHQMNLDQIRMATVKTTSLKGSIFQQLTLKLGRLKKFIFFKRGK
jgi:hypothetical protein